MSRVDESLPPLVRGTSLGKYRLRKRIGEGGFSSVWRAFDSIEGIDVAIKIPHAEQLSVEGLREFQKEARMAASLDHPNILKIKNADFIDRRFVIVYDIGEESLYQKMNKALTAKQVYEISFQILGGLSYAHEKGVVHRDLKPENIIFRSGSVRLADFGISRFTQKTIVTESPLGTLGYMAPEQAYGRATQASDVFSVGIMMYEMATDDVPEWPFTWPYKRHDRLIRRMGEAFADIIRRATRFDHRDRYQDAGELLMAVEQVEKKRKKRKQNVSTRKSKQRKVVPNKRSAKLLTDQFEKKYGKQLELDYSCSQCRKPISEYMMHCPWCGYEKNRFHDVTRFPYTCSDCGHGVYGDWAFCPWCYADKFSTIDDEPSKDRRYTGRCANARCGKRLMPYMHYCPWCHRKRRKPWRHKGLHQGCPKCHWSVNTTYWNYCPWCGHWPLT